MAQWEPQADIRVEPQHGLLLVPGTRVLTLEGALPVELLGPGDRIVTRSGARRLAGVEVLPLARRRMLRIGAGTQAHGNPDCDLLLPAELPVLVRGMRARLIHGVEQIVLPAERLADGRQVRLETAETRLIALRFDAAVVIYAGPVEAVSQPAPQSALA